MNIYDAKTTFFRLIKKAIAGEEVIIGRSGKPVAKLVPFQKPCRGRVPGSAEGKMFISQDFDAPLPDDLLKAFNQ